MQIKFFLAIKNTRIIIILSFQLFDTHYIEIIFLYPMYNWELYIEMSRLFYEWERYIWSILVIYIHHIRVVYYYYC